MVAEPGTPGPRTVRRLLGLHRTADPRRDVRRTVEGLHRDAAGAWAATALDRLEACAAERRDPGSDADRPDVRRPARRHCADRERVRRSRSRAAGGRGEQHAQSADDRRRRVLLHRHRDHRQPARRPRLRLAQPGGTQTMTAIATAGTDTLAGPRLGRRPARRRLRGILRTHPMAAISATYLAALTVAAAAAGVTAPHDPEQQDLAHVLAGPSALHWLGTDRLGRDVFSRLLFGARVTLFDVAVATAVFLAIGVPLGVAAGYRGRTLDRVSVRFADLLLAVPGIVVLLMVVAVFPGNDTATM